MEQERTQPQENREPPRHHGPAWSRPFRRLRRRWNRMAPGFSIKKPTRKEIIVLLIVIAAAVLLFLLFINRQVGGGVLDPS